MKAPFYYDFPEVQLSHVSSPHLDTGLTLIKVPRGSATAIDVRGGAVATREQSCVEETSSDGTIDALVLAGGSTYGLEAASGVMRKLFASRQYSSEFSDIPSVPSAIVYDWRNRTDSKVYPDREMGEQAWDLLKTGSSELGRVGGGTNVWVGKYMTGFDKEQSGLGMSFFVKDGFKLLAITVVNAVGNVLDFQGQVLRGSWHSQSQNRYPILPANLIAGSQPESGNTTISCIITNARLRRDELKRLAIMTHTGMARVIEPFHTPWDGDVMFSVSTGQLELNSSFSSFDLAIVAIHEMQKAVIQGATHGQHRIR
ncbi:MAG: P1 family peptidase [Pseudobdellovibrionaceae bacterium]